MPWLAIELPEEVIEVLWEDAKKRGANSISDLIKEAILLYLDSCISNDGEHPSCIDPN